MAKAPRWPSLPPGARVNSSSPQYAGGIESAVPPAPNPAAKTPALKYRNQPQMVGELRFDSKTEAARYQQLALLALAGKITELELQPRYPLEVNGHLIGHYTGDFRYRDEAGQLVVEDVKSKATKGIRDYPLRKKLMLACHGIAIVEIERARLPKRKT